MNTQILIWLKRNLFFSVFNTILSLSILYIIIIMAIPTLKWAVFTADFIGDGPEACTSGGACWVFIKVRLNQFIYGFYPHDQQWRINLSFLILLFSIPMINESACILRLAGSKYCPWNNLI